MSLEELQKSERQQADVVKALKADKAADPAALKAEVAKLKDLKSQIKVLVDAALAEKNKLRDFRAGFEDLMLRKFFYVNSFEIYGGVKGLYDYGPPGNAVMQNMLTLWRNHFVLNESMLEVSCACLSPDIVLRTSGHVEKFTDFMVRDAKTHDCLRADKILEEHIDALLEDPKKPVTAERREELLTIRGNADAYSQAELTKVLKELDVRSPDTGNEITEPFPFNLMFGTDIGPTGKLKGYMRPETAQGIFTNFRRLLEYNSGKVPFAAAQIGLGFRNEISPRSGLLRVREFMMAEIEHFVHPEKKAHPKFKRIENQTMLLLCKADQVGEEIPRAMTIGEAVKSGMVDNETLGYYMARTHQFLVACGIKEDRLRFRQHKDTEMAHYACDCWDAEIHTTYGWIEVAGHADRSAYDLEVHSAKSKVDLVAQDSIEPRMVDVCQVKPNMGLIGKKFRKEAKPLMAHVNELSEADKMKIKEQLEAGEATVTVNDKEFKLTPDMLSISMTQKKISTIKYTPNVIEPSFGVGRILYSVLEHSYYVRESADPKDKRCVLGISPLVAPIKVAILPLSVTDELMEAAENLARGFIALNVTSKIDDSGVSIGRKYARADELGMPCAVTIDFESVKTQTATIRDRDTTQQIRVSLDMVPMVVTQLVTASAKWADVYEKHEKVLRE